MSFTEFLKRPLHTAENYLDMLRKLLPRGPLWGFFISSTEDAIQDTYADEPVYDDVISAADEDTINDTISGSFDYASSTLGKFLSVIAAELERFEQRAYDLQREYVPGLSVELLDEWFEQTVRDEYERALCGDDDDAKRRLAHGKIYNEAQPATAQFFIDYAATLGFVITVNENPTYSNPFIMSSEYPNFSKMGVATDPSAQPDVKRMGGRGAFSIVEMTVVSGTGNIQLMQELFDKTKPAHVVIVWFFDLQGTISAVSTVTGSATVT